MLLKNTIREVMQHLGYDAPTIASKLGVSSNTVWRYLAGSVSPSVEVLGRLATLGKLDYKELLVQKTVEQASGRATARAGAVPLPHKPSSYTSQRREVKGNKIRKVLAAISLLMEELRLVQKQLEELDIE